MAPSGRSPDDDRPLERQGGDGPGLRGTLQQKPFPDVLAEIHHRRATGALALRRHPVEKIVYFREGVAGAVKSNLVEECLGRVMVRERMISEAECEESLRRMKGSGRRQGTVLMEMGCISAHNLAHALRVQLQTKLWELFRWDEGDYEWTGVEPPAEAIQLDIPASAIIYEGVKRAFDPTRLARVAGDLSTLYVHPAEDPSSALQYAGLSPEEMRLLKAIDGTRTVAELATLALLLRREATALIWAMRCARWVDLKDRPAAIPKATPPALPPRPPRLRPPARPTPPPLPREAVAAAKSPGVLLPELSEEDTGLTVGQNAERKRLRAHLEAIQRQDYFQILGVSRHATPTDVKQAYDARAEEYHPDKRFASAPAEIRDLVSQIHELISRAHATLADRRAREAYTREIASTHQRALSADVGKLVAAEGRFRKGEELMRRRQFGEARRYFEEAIRFYPEEGEFHAWLGWAIFQSAPGSEQALDAALEELDRAIRLSPRSDKGYLFSGYIYKAAGRPDKAQKHFEKALQCNPECAEATRELRLLRS